MKKLRFEIDDADIINEPENSHFATAKIRAFSTGLSRHNTNCDLDTLKRTASTIYEKPIVFEFDPRFSDFKTHNEGVTIPAGFVVPDSAEFKEFPDGRYGLMVLAKIWKKYSGKFVDIFKNDNTTKKAVSVELEILDADEKSDGVLNLKDMVFAAICVLGDVFTPASPDAEIQMLSFSKEYQEDFQLEFGSKYDFIDFKIPENIKSKAQKALNNHTENGSKASALTLAVARHLINNDSISPEKAKQVYKYFKNKDISVADDMYDFYGGEDAYEWCMNLCNQMDELDSKESSFFANDEGGGSMPYQSMKDVNPAVKGINPPVSLGQANEIAKAADAIGSDKEKNGWAIAISQFKKNHMVKDGKWIKKQNNSEEDFAKEDLGKGEAITVDKSKDAMATGSWGNVNKTELMHKVLNASNYKSLVNDVYMIVDSGWEDHPSSSLHYPVMQIGNGKAVYNRYGLAAALQRAEGQNESGVISKIHGVYKKLGLGDEAEKNAYAENSDDLENDEKEEMSMAKEKEEKAKEEEEMANKKPKEGSAEEEKQETPEEEKKEQEQGKGDKKDAKKEEMAQDDRSDGEDDGDDDDDVSMSLDANLDVSALLDFLKNETAEYKAMSDSKEYDDIVYSINACMGEISKGMEANSKVVTNAMLSYMKSMAKKFHGYDKQNKSFSVENSELRKFKFDRESEMKKFAVDSVLKEAFDAGMPEAEMEACREDAKNYSYENIDAYKNSVRAKAFQYFGSRESKVNDEIRIGFPFTQQKSTEPLLWK